MTHTGSNGSNAGDRIRAAGYSPSTWGENVAAGYSSCVVGRRRLDGEQWTPGQHLEPGVHPDRCRVGDVGQWHPVLDDGARRLTREIGSPHSDEPRPTTGSQTDGIGGCGWGTGGMVRGPDRGIGGDGSGTGG